MRTGPGASEVDLVIIGSGIIGATLAWNLRDSGMDVSLIDRAEPGAATTTCSYAWMNASSKVRLNYPLEYAEFSVRGALDPYRLANDIPSGWLHPTGNLELVAAHNADRLAVDVGRLLDLGYPVVQLDHAQLIQRHPQLAVAAGTVGAWYPTEGWIDGQALVADIVGRLCGGTFDSIRDEAVDFVIDRESGEITTVRLGSGRDIATRQVVLAAGAWTADLAAVAGVDVPMRARTDAKVPGLVIKLTAPESGLEHPIMGDGFLVRPHRGGEAVLCGDAHGTLLSIGMPQVEVTRAARRLLDAAARALPVLEECRIISARIGVRALTGDGKPIVGWCPGVPNLYVVATHSGISLAPTIGRLVAQEIRTRSREAELEPFRLARFSSCPDDTAGGNHDQRIG
jgi:glycine/D-amino acid oxidase-like deaminating enzyme